MQSQSVPRSTWIILAVVLLALAILTGTFVSSSVRQERSAQGTTQVIEGRRYDVDRSKPTQPVPACDLLPPDELQTILGSPVGAPVQTTADNPLNESLCLYPDPDNPDISRVQLGIVYSTGMEPFLIDNGYSVGELLNAREIGGGQTRTLEDIGDSAFWGGAGQEIWNGLQLVVWDIYLEIHLSGGDPALQPQQAQAIAGVVLESLYPPQ